MPARRIRCFSRFQSRNRIARLSSTGIGDADSSWNPSADDDVDALAVDGAGAVYAGGRFLNISGQPRTHLAKLATAGSGQADPGWAFTVDDSVKAIAISGSNLYAGGAFNRVDGQARWGLATFDSGGALGIGLDAERSYGPIYDTALQPNGGLIVAGGFMKANDQHRAGLLRLNPDGTIDPDWDPSANDEVRVLGVDSSGAVYASGLFTNIGGLPRSGLAKISGTGSGIVDPDWDPAPNGNVYSIAVDSFDSVYVGGSFFNIGGRQRTRIAKLASTGEGAADSAWAPQSNSEVFALAFAQNGDVYAGGWFSNIGGQPRVRIAKLAGTGTGAADPSWNPSANLTVRALAVGSDGSVYAGGDFTAIGGQNRARIGKLAGSGSGAADMSWDPSADGTVYSLAIDNNGAVYAGGQFSAIGGQPRSAIARLSAGGSGDADASWNPSASPAMTDIYKVTIGNSNTIIASGGFIGIGGQPRHAIAALPIDNDAIFRNGFEAAGN